MLLTSIIIIKKKNKIKKVIIISTASQSLMCTRESPGDLVTHAESDSAHLGTQIDANNAGS